MRYEYHNFINNLENIKNSKDMAITRELIVSEVAKVIDGRPFLVKKALINCGVTVSERAGKKELAKLVFYNLAPNSCLRTSLAELIVDNQYPVLKRKMGINRSKKDTLDTDLTRDEFMYAGDNNGGNNKSGGGGNTGDIIGGVTQLLSMGAGIWQGNKVMKDNQAQRAHELALADQSYELAVMQMQLDSNRPMNTPTEARMGGTSGVLTWILVGLGVVGIIGYSIYASRQN